MAPVVHLERVEGAPPQPWVALGMYVDTDLVLDSSKAELWAAGLHVEGEEATASGAVLEVSTEQGRRLSLAVPLVEMDGPATLQARLLEPLLAALQPR